MAKTAARKTYRRSDEEWAAEKARRAALVEAVKTFEADEESRAFETLTERYSHRNSMLIVMQRPTTRGDVKAKSKWAEDGLGKIRKGEHGLLILAPAKDRKADVELDETDKVTGQTRKMRFVWVRVYDRSQMEAWQDRAAAPAAPADPRTGALDNFLTN